MRPGRNDPCPCGSGLKYKRCCQPTALAEERVLRHPDGRAVDLGREWVAEALPLPIQIEERGSERPALLLVMADGVAIHQELIGRLEGGAEAVGTALEKSVRAAAVELGAYPETLIVRHEAVVDVLRPRLRGKEIRVEWEPSCLELEEFGRGIMEAFGGMAHWPPVGQSVLWRGWQLPDDVVSGLFEAAATFFEAAPWRTTGNLQAPRCSLPSGRDWTVCILGNAGEAFGLALYSDPADLYMAALVEDPDEAFQHFGGRTVTLFFEPGAGLLPEARKEFAVRGWPVAHARAYPQLMTVNAPGGGVSPEDARDLSDLLGAAPRFVAAHQAELRAEMEKEVTLDPFEWTDPETGIVFVYPEMPMGWPPGSGEHQSEAHEQIRAILREVEDEEHGDSEAFMRRANERMQGLMSEFNVQPQDDLGGLSPWQVERLLAPGWGDGGGALTLRRDLDEDHVTEAKLLANVRALIALAVDAGGLARTQAGNLKLPVVSACIDVMSFRREDYVEELRAASKRIREQDAWPVHEVRVLAELAKLIRPRGARFVLTSRGRELAEGRSTGELYALLFETCFRHFNLGYGGYGDWPELQYQIAYTLYRLRHECRSWRTAEDLVEGVTLPYAREREPSFRGVPDGSWFLQVRVLEWLCAFGLLESRPTSDRSVQEFRVTPLYQRFLAFDV